MPEEVKRGASARLLPKAVTHFVGFTGDEFNRAARVFGSPDFVHRYNDPRLWTDVAPGDKVVFANEAEGRQRAWSFNDSEHF